MKKSMLYTGIAYILAGLCSITLAVLFEWRIESLLWGLGGAGILPGLVMVCKYFHWTKPANREEYEERLKQERIEIRDERKVMLRDKSGRLAQQCMMLVYCLLMFFLAGCACMDRFMPFARYAVIGLCALLVLQYFLWQAAFRYLSKKL